MKHYITNVQMIIIFVVLAFYNVVDQVESSSRLFRFDKLYKDSDGLKSQVTLINGLASVDVAATLPAPSLVQPAVHSVTEKVGVLVVRSRILAELSFVESPSGSPNVLVILICSLLLARVLIGLIWFICAKSDLGCCKVEAQNPRKDASPLTSFRPGSSVDGQGSRGSVASVSPFPPPENGHGGGVSEPATHPLDPPVANARSVGESKPSHPPAPPVVANASGDGGKAKPSYSPNPQANERCDGESKPRPTNQPRPPTHPPSTGGGSKPTHPGPSISNGLGSAGSKPSNVPVVNGNGGDGFVAAPPSAPPNGFVAAPPRYPIRVTEPGESSVGPSILSEVGLMAFLYKDLRDSTDNFSTANYLGEGAFAKVYKGSLSKDRKVAVKVLRNENSKVEKEFRNEVNIISRARHINIVSLVGYCITPHERLIVYEFVENRSLHDHLMGGKDIQLMDWAIRIKIARGASKGLAYLHEECGIHKIIHRDVKPANILLDLNFVPKVADFGISKLCPENFDSLIATYIIGSRGFMDPVYLATNEFSSKTDVYAFGVVLLMLISGLIDLVKVHGLKKELSTALKSCKFDGIADERLNKKYNVDEMTRMVTCADACLRTQPKDRPDMSLISQVLENIVSTKELRIKTMPRRRV